MFLTLLTIFVHDFEMERKKIGWVFLGIFFILILEVNGEIGNNVSKGNNVFSARNMLEKIATTLMSRAGTTSSQVLSLNLTNLLILVLLKALIFAAGSVGAGAWKGGSDPWKGGPGGAYARIEDEDDGLISDTEMLLFLGYIAGTPGNHKCMQNVACHKPDLAGEYVKAGKALLKTVNNVPNVFGDYTGYKISLLELQEATEAGEKQYDCDLLYQCPNQKIHRK